MKKLVILLPFLILPLFVNAQSMSVRRMLRAADPGKEVTRIYVPGCVMKFACLFVDEPETRSLLRKMGSVYVWTTEDGSYASESNVPTEIAQKLKKRNFEEMLSANSDGEQVNIMMRERGKKKEYVIAVNGDEDAVIYLKSKLTLADLAKETDFNIKGVKLNQFSQIR